MFLTAFAMPLLEIVADTFMSMPVYSMFRL